MKNNLSDGTYNVYRENRLDIGNGRVENGSQKEIDFLRVLVIFDAWLRFKNDTQSAESEA